MDQKSYLIDLDSTAILFENLVTSAFDFLENLYKMRRNSVRVINKNDPMEVAVKVRFESETHRFDITWAISQYGLGILIWDKTCIEASTVYNKNCSAYFEPLLEFLTNGSEKPIIPQIFPKMPTKKVIEVVEERKRLFDVPLAEIIDKLAAKLKKYQEVITLLNHCNFEKYNKWFNDYA